ncbi:cytochrome c oxidase subunit I [Micromonospora sp. NPDC006766]|uniref:cytochrome c oxidase subunit I n=1 Tax=Micromonospora sp. NPDC006766 TaxID=3154778 RepID=UPI0033CEB37A
MSTTTTKPPGASQEDLSRLEEHWGEPPSLRAWFSTVDHKKIGRRYIVTAGLFFVFAGISALLMRTQLATPESGILSPQEYNQLFTMHGTSMIFLFATPMFFGLGNFLVPLMIGSRDMAFPRLNAFGYWVFLFAGLFMWVSVPFGEAPNAGWFNYAPLTNLTFEPGLAIDVYNLGLLFLGISTTAGAINFIVTALKLRAPGMSLNRVPLFVWAIVATSFMVVFALPALNLDNLLLFLDRRFDTHFFDPSAGGNVLLWQHLFWIFGHPDVYIIVMPGLGIVSSVLPAFARRGVVAYPLVVLAIVSISILSFGVWVHHMFATGLPQLSYSFFSAASTIITIPSGIQFFAWLATMALGRLVIKVPLLFLIGFLFTFLIGGLTGAMFAVTAFDQQVTDSYFVVAHFHYVLLGGAVFPMLAGLYYWLPKVTGRMYHEGLGRWAFWLVLAGMQLTFFPMHLYGLFGMPRRVYTYRGDLGWDVGNLIATVGAYVLAAGLLLVLIGVVHAIRRGRPAPSDPWGGDTLEWTTTSPPESYNFPVLPQVHSLHPTWDERTAESIGAGATQDRILSEGRRTLFTSELDARYERAVEMAESTLIPFVLACWLLLFFISMLFSWWLVAGFAAVAVVVTMGVWLWPSRRPAEKTG